MRHELLSRAGSRRNFSLIFAAALATACQPRAETPAVGAGISGDAVAASLGHESFAVTAAHYAQPEAVFGAKAAKVADTLG